LSERDATPCCGRNALAESTASVKSMHGTNPRIDVLGCRYAALARRFSE